MKARSRSAEICVGDSKRLLLRPQKQSLSIQKLLVLNASFCRVLRLGFGCTGDDTVPSYEGIMRMFGEELRVDDASLLCQARKRGVL